MERTCTYSQAAFDKIFLCKGLVVVHKGTLA